MKAWEVKITTPSDYSHHNRSYVFSWDAESKIFTVSSSHDDGKYFATEKLARAAARRVMKRLGLVERKVKT